MILLQANSDSLLQQLILYDPSTNKTTETWKIDDNKMDGSRQVKRLGPLQRDKIYSSKIVLESKRKINVSKDGEDYEAIIQQRYVQYALMLSKEF